MKIKIVLMLTLALISCNYGKYKYTINVSRGRYVLVFHTNKILKDSTGCISFLDSKNRPQLVCGNFIITEKPQKQ